MKLVSRVTEYLDNRLPLKPGQPRQLYDALTCPKELVSFTAAEGADSHCEPKALGLRDQRIFDWLDETLG